MLVGQPGTNKKEEFSSKAAAQTEFRRTYLDKTGNDWADRANCEKKVGKFYPIEVEYADEEEIKLLDVSKARGSRLDARVQK